MLSSLGQYERQIADSKCKFDLKRCKVSWEIVSNAIEIHFPPVSRPDCVKSKHFDEVLGSVQILVSHAFYSSLALLFDLLFTVQKTKRSHYERLPQNRESMISYWVTCSHEILINISWTFLNSVRSDFAEFVPYVFCSYE